MITSEGREMLFQGFELGLRLIADWLCYYCLKWVHFFRKSEPF
mgnify:CR=1